MKLNCFKEKPKEEVRKVRPNDPEYNAQFKYKKNKIITSRYNIFTFLPLNLFEQSLRIANTYFLILVILQLIPAISSLNPITTIIPLVIVLSVTAIKDAVDDWNRHKSDDEINNRKTLTLKGGERKLEEIRWMNTNVGDLVKLENNQFVTADILLLSSSDDNNLVYIETAELDGETNLKVRQSLPETGMLGDDLDELSKFDAHIECEPPNEHLHRFKGNMKWNSKEYALDNDKMLLRGCRVRNTDWCFGVVIYAGPDSKLMMNTGKSVLKRTSIDRLMNTLVWLIFAFLITLATVCAIGNTVWESQIGIRFQVYQPWMSYIENIYKSGFLAFWSYIIILNTVVPISLYVSVEVIRLMQSWFIDWDRLMYYSKKDLPACARTTTLNEELGQIEYIFSDKTGTLTQNVMVFKKCSINGISYGNLFDSEGNQITPDEMTPTVDLSSNPYYEKSFHFHDQILVDEINQKKNKDCWMFFRLCAICHTVMPEIDEDEGSLTYQAQSPDENALVSAARNFGFVFKERTYNTITVSEMGTDVVYELLAILDFDNVRKRMSVIVRSPSGEITLFCKGADTVIYERLKQDQDCAVPTSEHLEDFATDGLRTLCLAIKTITEHEYSVWKEVHEEAAKSIEDRDERLAAAYEEIERDLILIGATAIEDKLQDGVPETIANLAEANIKIWVLTGDKQETAINIGYSCNMLTEEMKDIFVISGGNPDEVAVQINDSTRQVLTSEGGDAQQESRVDEVIYSDLNPPSSSDKYGLVINGHSLAYALQEDLELDFLNLASKCTTVICCRVTPLQKAQVVELVKKYKSAVTLSIGDGANDVSMIKAAHVGVGISGEEGTQAVLSSDFAFGQFRYLERLLLVHGRWSYMRMSKFLGYFFYKNFAFTLVHFWYAFFCGFQAQSIYDAWLVTLYNVVYTSMPIIVLALLDQDLNDSYCIRYPKLYLPGQRNEGFNKKIFFIGTLRGVLTSLVLFFFTYGAFHTNSKADGNDITDLQSVGTVVATSLIIIVNLKVAFDTQYWTAINHFFIWGSIAIYFVMSFALYSDGIFFISPVSFPYIGAARNTYSQASVWFCIMLTTVVCVLPELAIKVFRGITNPTYTDIILRKQVSHRKHFKNQQKSSFPFELPTLKDPFKLKRKPSTRPHSGYAFDHERGFGEMITSGRMSMRRKSSRRVDTVSHDNHTTKDFAGDEIHEATNALPDKNGSVSYHNSMDSARAPNANETYRKFSDY